MELSNRWRRAICTIELRLCLIFGCAMVGVGVFSAALCSLLGGRCSLYYYLWKPPLALPRLLFLIIWPVMFFLIGACLGIAVGRRQACHHAEKCRLYVFFTLLILFCVLWCPLFFAARAFFLALVDCGCIVAMTVLCLRCFFRIHGVAGIGACIFLAFVIYCFYLNFFIFLRNG